MGLRRVEPKNRCLFRAGECYIDHDFHANLRGLLFCLPNVFHGRWHVYSVKFQHCILGKFMPDL